MKADIDRKNSEIDTLRNKVNELEGALKTCEERAINLQDAVSYQHNYIQLVFFICLSFCFFTCIQVSTYCNSVTILETSEEAAQSQVICHLFNIGSCKWIVNYRFSSRKSQFPICNKHWSKPNRKWTKYGKKVEIMWVGVVGLHGLGWAPPVT